MSFDAQTLDPESEVDEIADVQEGDRKLCDTKLVYIGNGHVLFASSLFIIVHVIDICNRRIRLLGEKKTDRERGFW